MGQELIQSQPVSVAEGLAAEEPGEFTQYMRAAYWRHSDLKAALAKEQAEHARERAAHEETNRLLALAELENARLQEELKKLRNGVGVVIAIGGRSFSLSIDALPMERSEEAAPTAWSINDDWLNGALPHKHDTQQLTKSLTDSYLS